MNQVCQYISSQHIPELVNIEQEYLRSIFDNAGLQLTVHTLEVSFHSCTVTYYHNNLKSVFN